MKKQVTIKLMIVFGILLMAFFLILKTGINIGINKQFFQGILSGLSAIAVIVWLINLVGVYTKGRKLGIDKNYFRYPPFLRSLAMLCLFMAILFINSISGILILIISIILIGTSIVLNIKAAKKT